MTRNKKIILATLGGLAVVGGIWIARQVKKMMNYTLTYKRIKPRTANQKTLDFDVFFDYQNKADIDIKLSEQEYDVYVNDVYITTLKNYSENILKANSTSELGFNVNLNLPDLDKKIRTTYVKMLLEPKAVVRIEMKWKVRFGFIKIPVKYTWVTNLKEILGWYLPVYRK